jgi:hypothetical protein
MPRALSFTDRIMSCTARGQALSGQQSGAGRLKMTLPCRGDTQECLCVVCVMIGAQ